jgi:hypothetical protein
MVEASGNSAEDGNRSMRRSNRRRPQRPGRGQRRAADTRATTTATTAVSAARRHPRGRHRRTLHLVDVENLLGTPRTATAAAIRATLDAYRRAIRVGGDDLVVLAANPALALEIGLAWPGALLRTARGPDGADLALLDDVRDLTALGDGRRQHDAHRGRNRAGTP